MKSAVETYTSNRQEEAEREVRRLKSHLQQAEAQGNEEAKNQLQAEIALAEEKAQSWGTGGRTKRTIDAITNAGLIALSGGSSQSVATAVASPYVNQLIKNVTKDYPALNIPTHILWGAVEAELMGSNAQTGAISTAAGELGAKYLTEHLYGKESKNLSETERSQIKEMAKALAGVAGGLVAAGQGASAVKILKESSVGMTVANNAVEYNYLTANEAARKAELMMLIQTEINPEKKAQYQEELDDIIAKDIRTQKEIEDSCPRFGKGSSACQASILDAEKARQSYNRYSDEFQPLGYSKEKRQYKNVFAYDYGRTNEALAGKDPLTLQKEAFAVEVAKAKNTLPEQEYNWVSNGIDLGKLGEFQGWGRTIKGLPKAVNSNKNLPIIGKTIGYGDVKLIYRQDDNFLSKNNHKGALKAYIGENGDLIPANPTGSASVQSHVRGGNSKNSPFISFTDPRYSNGVKSYGKETISINLQRLSDDIKAGKLPNTQIILHSELKYFLDGLVNDARARYELNSTTRNRVKLERAIDDLNNVKRDGECLIKGCVPSEYILRGK
ncbi:hypothetical protein BKK48_09660 [Rodentibacter heidelbergensis]|uniref:Uncharacterized protein n=1 Tax=Rodentibacter heidelbergensis TaxID=1908258 RepID=A0A1V3I6M4_9PAST|nr:hypothetical protein BKK48_09660 [Rodentibacter heidelbergensis]